MQWNELWTRWTASGPVREILEVLPEPLAEPPGIWVLLGGAVLLLGWLLWRLLFGVEDRRARKLVKRGRREVKRDLKECLRQGDLKEAGEIYEALGKPRKALRAYAEGGHHEERVSLLLRLDRRAQAMAAAREGGVWHLVAELAQEDGDDDAAAVAWERAAKPFLAARAWERAGEGLEAARCFTAAGLEADAVRVLGEAAGPEAAEILEQAVRESLQDARGASMSLEMTKAVRRAVQLWIAEGEPQRAWRLAVDAEQLELAAPIARDFLDPTAEAAELAERAEAWLAAAEIWKGLGDSRRESLARAAHAERRDDPEEASRWLEAAGETARAADAAAAAGDLVRAGDLFAEAGELRAAADHYAEAGDEEKRDEMLRRLGGGAPSEPEDPFGEGMTVRTAAHEREAEGSPESQLETVGPPGAGPEASRRHAAGAADTRRHATDAVPESLQPDERYRLLEELGRGGMGRVYRAEDRMLHREVAYKILPENLLGDLAAPESLLEEARAAARLSHPNIVQIYDVGRKGAGFFVVMELVRGDTFERLLKERNLSPRGVIQVGRQIASALAHAHERQIVHRDLKPSNLLWSEAKRVKLADFGLARISDDVTGKVATRPAGTPSYMAPEQIRGEELDARTDLYALGCVLYEMATGKPAFGGGMASLTGHLEKEPSDPRHLRDDLPDGLGELILACLAKDPAERPRSAREVGERLAALV